MSPLFIRPGRNAAREAQRLKEIRKVKIAIRWHEQQREKRQKKKKELHDLRAMGDVQRKIKAQESNMRRRALRSVREDWHLGPLRPNRAVGERAGKYGALTQEDLGNRSIDANAHQKMNENRAKRGQELKYPLIVDDKGYFPIVQGDRVLVIKGRSKNQTGLVDNVMEETHEVRIKGVNNQYYSSESFGAVGAEQGPKAEQGVPIPMEDVRLIIPHYRSHDVQKHHRVIADKIFMERHTTGIDPYTGTDYGDARIPEEHQNDPLTGLPIFHRYIAGTQQRIPWPWEKEERKKEIDTPEKAPADKKSWFTKTLGTIRHPITSLRRWRSPDEETKPAQKKKKIKKPLVLPRGEPQNLDPAYDMIDTTRNIVEAEHSMAYTILAPPMPETLSSELRDEIRDLTTQMRKDSEEAGSSVMKLPRTSSQEAQAQKAVKEKRALEKMKTPLQLRWELDQAKKRQLQQQQSSKPSVDMESLLIMLGQHMQKNQVRLPKKGGFSKAQEVD